MERIFCELESADVFVALLSSNFKRSDWCSQELGIARIRRVKIVPFSLDGTIPFGFIRHLQCGWADGQGRISLNDLVKPFIDGFPNRMISSIIEELGPGRASSFRDAEAVMGLLVDRFDEFAHEHIRALGNPALEGGAEA